MTISAVSALLNMIATIKSTTNRNMFRLSHMDFWTNIAGCDLRARASDFTALHSFVCYVYVQRYEHDKTSGKKIMLSSACRKTQFSRQKSDLKSVFVPVNLSHLGHVH